MTPKILYHLSKTNHDGKIFIPRIPSKDSRMDGEDWRSKRVCLCPDIEHCLKAIFAEKDVDYYVHAVDVSDIKIYMPTIKQVPDLKETHEIWAKEPVVLHCIGKIKNNASVYFDEDMSWTWVYM